MKTRHAAERDRAPLILVCSAAPELAVFLRHILEREGGRVEIAMTADDAGDRLNTCHPQVALIDGEFEDALDLCRRLSVDGSGIRLVVLFGPNGARNYPAFLAAGMDEGLTRPVEPGTIVNAVLRRIRQPPGAAEDRLSFDDIEIDIAARRVWRGGREIRLTGTEFQLLCCFMRAPGRVLTRQDLIAGAWPKAVFVDPRTVNIHVGRLRRRLIERGGRDVLRTVRGLGYALDGSGGEREA